MTEETKTLVFPQEGEKLSPDMEQIKFIGESLIAAIHFVVSENVTDILVKPGIIKKKEIGKWETVDGMTPESFRFSDFVKSIIKVNPSLDPTKGAATSVAFTGQEGMRVRVTLSSSGGQVEASIRILPSKIKTFEELGFKPEHIPLLDKIAKRRNGLVIFCGPTGNGKSSSMAALLNIFNKNTNLHILTIEDPIETILPKEKATVTQREIGLDIQKPKNNEDVDSGFSRGVDEAFRQTPDLIAIGEIRTETGTKQAFRASESGHLTISTTHASDSVQCLITLFNRLEGHLNPVAVAERLSKQIVSIIAQRLIRLKNGKVQLVYEILDLTTEKMILAVKNQKWKEIPAIMNENSMPEINKQITQLMKQNAITEEEANRVLYM